VLAALSPRKLEWMSRGKCKVAFLQQVLKHVATLKVLEDEKHVATLPLNENDDDLDDLDQTKEDPKTDDLVLALFQKRIFYIYEYIYDT
jgi:hypothetical protein